MSEPPTGPETQVEKHLQRLRHWRDGRAGENDLRFVRDQFKREIEKPFKQLEKIIPVWERVVPEPLRTRTKLESLRRGVLTVHVRDSATLYELDRELRGGITDHLREQYPGTLRRVKLVQAPFG